MHDAFIHIKDLHKWYGKKAHAVKGITYTIKQGESFALLGPNGAGKTTTIRMICGLTGPTSGTITLNGLHIDRKRAAYLRHIGLVCQHFNIDTDLTGYENLIIHAMLFNVHKQGIKKRCLELLEFSGLLDKKDTRVKHYSGGMKKKLQIIRSLVHDPDVLILDEPTAGLDPHSRIKIWTLMNNLKKQGKTIIFSTHYMEEAEKYADRVGIINRGTIIALDRASALIDKLGVWCRETVINNENKRSFHATKQAAEAMDTTDCDMLTIRPVNLEDVFVTLTGEKDFT